VRATRPDVIIHQLTDLSALHDHPEEALQRNSALRKTGTANLVAAAQAAGVPAMVAQSIAWIYAPGREPHEESAPLDVTSSGTRRVSVDGVISLESAVLTTPGLQGCVLRYGQFYGPGTPNKDGSRSEISVHVEAAAWAAVLAAESGSAGIYNVADPNRHVSTDKVRRELRWQESLRA
jgi:nucleoside-diphosphate-sugar epimerase